MLYPLSYRGTFKSQHVSTSKTYVKRAATVAAALVEIGLQRAKSEANCNRWLC
jgi:hypothetical protein